MAAEGVNIFMESADNIPYAGKSGIVPAVHVWI
jgi:hypothetical protein